MKTLLIIYWWIAVALDWSSTIVAHDWRVEENPVMSYFWRVHGETGFTLFTLFTSLIFSLGLVLGFRHRLWFLVWFGMFPVITFKVLIALTNLAVIPYWVTDWFQF